MKTIFVERKNEKKNACKISLQFFNPNISLKLGNRKEENNFDIKKNDVFVVGFDKCFFIKRKLKQKTIYVFDIHKILNVV